MIKLVSQALNKRQNGEKGFTLIELLVVVIIIGILAAVAIPVFLNMRQGAWKSSVESDVKNAVLAIEQATTANNGSTTGLAATQSGAGQIVSVKKGTDEIAKATTSDGNTLTVTFSSNTYTIVGTNVNVTDTGYKYDSTTGKGTWAAANKAG